MGEGTCDLFHWSMVQIRLRNLHNLYSFESQYSSWSITTTIHSPYKDLRHLLGLYISNLLTQYLHDYGWRMVQQESTHVVTLSWHSSLNLSGHRMKAHCLRWMAHMQPCTEGLYHLGSFGRFKDHLNQLSLIMQNWLQVSKFCWRWIFWCPWNPLQR